ncbi:MAG: hypothetical protein KZQ73_04555 [Candidatus Thiodiazotropha sp. (ex Semelilucina semeliformis)]|nr:hypothetical protein [Candidatus Thiodiazotropha sp. (ex Semelilucina semeliformis)]
MSKNSRQLKYFDEFEIDDIGGWYGYTYFPPIDNKVQVLIPGEEDEINIPIECELFYEELIAIYPELSKRIQKELFKLHNEFEEMKTIGDVWKIFQLESISIDDTKLDDSDYWSLNYGTDYGGHIIEFEMKGRNISDSLLQG